MNVVDIQTKLAEIDSAYMAEMAAIDEQRNKATANYNAERNRLMVEILNSKQQEDDDTFLNVRQAAEFLNISQWLLRKQVEEKTIPFKKVGNAWRFSKHELIRYQRGEWKSEAEQIADAYVAKSLRLRK